MKSVVIKFLVETLHVSNPDLAQAFCIGNKGVIESGARRKKRALHCFSSVNEAEELPTDEHTNGPMEVTDNEEEKPAALPVSMSTEMPDSEKEELLTRTIKAAQILRKEGPMTYFVKGGTPTMGELFFIPVGVIVAGLFNRASSVEVYGVMTMTLVYAGIGLLDDGLSLFRKHNYGLPGKVKFTLQVVAGILFFRWLESANVSSPYKMWASF
ncbi:hypothetical protein AXG93_3472s1080 [Marchantia polymorpha subsp. ruderalis]|uniref:Uncharacterized protein n=1 Tax=Marchantia polymorpha subsp. ruderalis TaxID=1480154 RepID=A0A176WPK5_MARPO|nr:hypothetical protein AXG93_3472s1080 [Marchantia polymorpha subsp. ruderalis]